MTDILPRDTRALSSVVEKSFVAGIALLYVGGMMGLLLGSVVPGYQAATGEQLGERTLATATEHIEQAPPQTQGAVESTTTVTLPATIRGNRYELRLANETLTLESSGDGFEREIQLALPEHVTTTESTWNSGGDLLIRVEGPATNRTLTIEGER